MRSPSQYAAEAAGLAAERRLREWLAGSRNCNCRDPLPGRVYLGRPACVLCRRPIEPPWAP